jgi:hypothetical protein
MVRYYLTRHKTHAKEYGWQIITFNIPKKFIYFGNSESDWIASGKPIWDKGYKTEAIAKGIPKKYITGKIVVIGDKEYKY